MNLGDIAEIKTGLVLTRKKAMLDTQTQASYKLITLKNINEDGTFNGESFEIFQSNEPLEPRYFTAERDILIRLSHPNTAVYVGEQQSGLLVPSYFAIVKVNQTKFLAEYIAWYLNTFEVKKELERSQAGSRIPSTNQNVLKTIPVLNTAFSKQKALIELLRLHRREIKLYEQLIKEKEQLFRGITEQVINKEEQS
ncbi:restriction endonuclease subunit S [Neobacillus niacini]|uniref:restriction endonuclease subunit S n=1 Tax=Neobacillus niacini TaxID=86668 RepID=UPI0030009FBA